MVASTKLRVQFRFVAGYRLHPLNVNTSTGSCRKPTLIDNNGFNFRISFIDLENICPESDQPASSVCTLMMVWRARGLNWLVGDGGVGGTKWALGHQTIIVGPCDNCRVSSQQGCERTIKPTWKRDTGTTAVDTVLECIYQAFCPKTLFLLGQRLFGNAQRSVAPLKTVVTASLRTISSGKQIIPVSLFEMLQWAKIWWTGFHHNALMCNFFATVLFLTKKTIFSKDVFIKMMPSTAVVGFYVWKEGVARCLKRKEEVGTMWHNVV